MQLIRKSVEASEVKVLDEAKGLIESYVNTLGVWDHDTERMKDGTFDRYIERTGRLPKVAWFHDQRTPVGKCIETQQVGNRQRVVTQFNMDTQRGREAFSDVAGGYVDEWSVGFYALEDEWLPIEGKAKKGRQINEIDWVEYSPVMRGASPDTGTGWVKERKLDDDAEAEEKVSDALDLKIAHRDGEPESPPKGYPTDTSQYADPANFKWPLDTRARIHSAVAYYNAGAGRSKYSEDEWATVGHRIAAAASREFGGGYSLDGGTITTPNTRKGRSGLRGKFFAQPSESSFEDIQSDLRRMVTELLCGQIDPWGYEAWPYADICETHPDFCIASVCGGDDCDYFRIPYTIGPDQEPKLGDPEPVELAWMPRAHAGAEPKQRRDPPAPATPDGAAGTDRTAALLKLRRLELAAKGIRSATIAEPELKRGARNSAADQDRIQAVHDHAVSLGAQCGDMDDDGDSRNGGA